MSNFSKKKQDFLTQIIEVNKCMAELEKKLSIYLSEESWDITFHKELNNCINKLEDLNVSSPSLPFFLSQK